MLFPVLPVLPVIQKPTPQQRKMALTRKTWLIAKIESSYGTDPSPVGGSNAIQVSGVELTPIESDNVQAAAFQGFLGNSTRGTLVANKRVSVSFDVELS